MQSVYLTNLAQTNELLHSRGPIRLFWVDIDLGRGRANEGIDVIKAIKKIEPDALIIVYSAYPAKEKACVNAGANFFIKKNPVSYETDLQQLRYLIIFLLGLLNKKESWRKIVNMYSQIVDIDEERGLVRLNCKLEMESNVTFERIFPLSLFKNSDKLTVNQSIHVQTLERAGEIRFLFENTNEDYFEEEEDIDISDLDDSPIFKTKDT
jgi:hypothetical protein